MDSDSRRRLRHNLDVADEEALVALANRGLVRRALKDLEQYPPLDVEETESALRVRGPGFCVTMPPEGPSAARDDSGATGITRLIIAATLYLRNHWLPADDTTHASTEHALVAATGSAVGTVPTASPETTSPVPGSDETSVTEAQAQFSSQMLTAEKLLIDATVDELTKWAGKGVFLQAAAKLKSIVDYEIARYPTLSIDFKSEGAKVLLMTDRPATTLKRLLDQFRTTLGKSDLAYWVMLSVLVLKRETGEDLSSTRVLEADITAAVRDDRLRLAERCQRLLLSAVISGLAHPSGRMVQRFETMGVAAEAARFPRLARLLSSMASDIELQIARSAAASLERMLERLLIVHGLCRAALQTTQTQPPELYGRARSHYLPAGDLDLFGLGAYAWRTDSGYEGVTVVFWCANQQRFMTASQARGEGQDRSFSFHQAYESAVGWGNAPAIQNLCRQHLKLEESKLNWDGRLSSTSSCRAVPLEPTRVEQIDFGDRVLASWSELLQRARQLQSLGLRVSSTSDALVVVRPAQWGQRWFDELEQQFVWELVDDNGQVIQLRVPWCELEESSIAFLESIKPEREKLWAVLGQIVVRDARVSVYPLTLLSLGGIRGDTILCPHFDHARIESVNHSLLQRLRSKYGRVQQVATGMSLDDEADATTDSLQFAPIVIRRLITEVEELLRGVIESGVGQLNEWAIAELRASAETAAGLNLQPLERALRSLIQRHEPSDRSPAAVAFSILSAAYIARLAHQSAARLCLHA